LQAVFIQPNLFILWFKIYQMNRILFVVLFMLAGAAMYAQSNAKTITVGHPVTISIPDYMNRTVGINSSALIQYKSEVKEVYGFVIEDGKEELKMAEMHFASIKDFYDDFIGDFIKDEEKLKQSTPVSTQKNGINYIEADISFYDKEAETEIYYLIGIVETKTAFYKVLSYCSLESKAKFKSDFQKILYSLKD
jgi:hypothetical protein